MQERHRNDNYVDWCPISWKVKFQDEGTLSSTKSEYVALRKTNCEVKFITQLMEAMNIKFKNPVEVFGDNFKVVILTENRTSSKPTKHIDIKCYYIREQMDICLIQVRVVKSGYKLSDLFTKNIKHEVSGFTPA
jgi:hypothetical protein